MQFRRKHSAPLKKPAGAAAGCVAAAAGVLAAVVLTAGIPAMASPRVMGDGNVFDPELYASLYPDVTQAVGTSTEALYQHYLTSGQKEGRIAYDPSTVTDTSLLPREAPDYNIIYATPVNDFARAYAGMPAKWNSEAYSRLLGDKYSFVSYADGYFLYDLDQDGYDELFLCKKVEDGERLTDIFKFVPGEGAKEVPAPFQIGVQVEPATRNDTSTVRNLSKDQFQAVDGDKMYGVYLTADNLLELHHKSGYEYYQLDLKKMTVTRVSDTTAKRAHPLAVVTRVPFVK